MPENKQATHSPNEESISYEEAAAREEEYQNRMRMRSPHPPLGPGSICTSFQEPNSVFIGMKRKAASVAPQKRMPRTFFGQHMQPWQLCDQHSPQQRLLVRHPPQATAQRFQDLRLPHQQHNYQQGLLPRPQFQHALPQQFQYPQLLPQRLHYRNPSLQVLSERQPSDQGLRSQQCFPQQQPDSNPVPQQSCDRLWCSLCKVPCMDPLNLEQHLQGKKHKAKWEEVFGSKKHVKTLWCNECMVPCMNEMALAQHRVGKKHAARLLALQAANLAASTARSEHDGEAASTSYVENHGQLRMSALNNPSRLIQDPNS